MRGKFMFLLTPLLSVNSLFILLNTCHKSSAPRCSYFYSASLTAMNNADSLPRVADAAGVLAKAFVLQLDLKDTSYTCMREQLFPVNAAYADYFSPVTLMPVDSMVLTSDHDFDATHPAGSDLYHVFSMSDTSLNYFHIRNNYLYLTHLPSDTGTHTFTIKLYMSDTTKNLIAVSKPVKLLL